VTAEGHSPLGPQRTCVGCRQVKSKGELVRLVAGPGRVQVDLSATAPGRGAYLCRTPACWTLAERRRALDRAIRAMVTVDDWRRLREGILT
jgi:predicted RNA-binding protein YlxR (DUF448 family)